MIVTGLGSWSPLIFLLCFATISIIVFFIRCLGEKECIKEKEKTVLFFSGNPPPIENRATNIYWGFFEAMGRYYRRMKRIHSGVVNDYVYWFVFVVVVIMCVVIFL